MASGRAAEAEMETGVVVAAVAATAAFMGEGGGGLVVGAKRGWVPVSNEAWCQWLWYFLCRGDVCFWPEGGQACSP